MLALTFIADNTCSFSTFPKRAGCERAILPVVRAGLGTQMEEIRSKSVPEPIELENIYGYPILEGNRKLEPIELENR